MPEIGSSHAAADSVDGEPPSAVRVPAGCRFHPRCPWVVDRCLRESPELLALAPGHLAARHVAERRAVAAGAQ